jgi:hypothetical protein
VVPNATGAPRIGHLKSSSYKSLSSYEPRGREFESLQARQVIKYLRVPYAGEAKWLRDFSIVWLFSKRSPRSTQALPGGGSLRHRSVAAIQCGWVCQVVVLGFAARMDGRGQIDAKIATEQFRRQYDEARPHSSLCDLKPAESKMKLITATTNTESGRPSSPLPGGHLKPAKLPMEAGT